MNRFQYINDNLLNPKGIREQIKLGIIPSSIIKHFEIYSRFDYYKKQGYNISKSVFFAAEDFRTTEGNVYKIKKSMESEL